MYSVAEFNLSVSIQNYHILVSTFDSFSFAASYSILYIIKGQTVPYSNLIFHLIVNNEIQFTWSSEDKGDKIMIKNFHLSFTGDNAIHNIVRTTKPIPSSFTSFYFEAKIVNSGQNNIIGIGLTQSEYGSRSGEMPGWNNYSTLGIGYHGNDGGIYYKSGKAIDHADTFQTGDVVGCLIFKVEIDNKQFILVQFTKNGRKSSFPRLISNTVNNYWVKEWYPTIGMASPGASVDINFGQHKFVYLPQGTNSELFHDI